MEDFRPEIGWIPIDLLFAGVSDGMSVPDFLLFADALVESGTIEWVQSCLAGTDAPPLQKILPQEFVSVTATHPMLGSLSDDGAHYECGSRLGGTL